MTMPRAVEVIKNFYTIPWSESETNSKIVVSTVVLAILGGAACFCYFYKDAHALFTQEGVIGKFYNEHREWAIVISVGVVLGTIALIYTLVAAVFHFTHSSKEAKAPDEPTNPPADQAAEGDGKKAKGRGKPTILPDGWESEDPGGGKVLYTNKATGESISLLPKVNKS